MNSKNNLEMNNKIEICNEGKKAYDIVLRDSFADLLDQMEFLEICLLYTSPSPRD